MMMRDILVPVDGSDGSNHAARFAAFLARESGAKITLLHVHEASTAEMVGLASQSQEQIHAREAGVAAGSFAGAREAIAEFDVETNEATRLGHPATEIVAAAQELRPQLVVMGSRGLSLMKELLIGSVSDHVLRHAPCPVTIVR